MLELDCVSKRFSESFYPALNNLSLNLDAGEFCTIIGSNGSGKSTLLKTISGEHKPDLGKIIIDGFDATSDSLARRSKYISSVVQDVNKGTVPEMTLLENIILSKVRRRGPEWKSAQQSKTAIMQELRDAGLMYYDYYIEKPLSFLSGGQRQVIATMMAAMSQPKILLLDEHTSALDTNMREMLMQIIAKITEKYRITTLMVTHRLDDALNYGNRLVMMSQGVIVLNISGSDKKSLTIHDLLKLFHEHEDKTLGAP